MTEQKGRPRGACTYLATTTILLEESLSMVRMVAGRYLLRLFKGGKEMAGRKVVRNGGKKRSGAKWREEKKWCEMAGRKEVVRNGGKKRSGAKWREEKFDTWQSLQLTIPIIRYPRLLQNQRWDKIHNSQ